MSYVSDFLSDIEKEKINSFVADEVMFEAVRKVLLASIYQNGTLRKDVKANSLTNGAFALVALASSGQGVVSDQDLGQDLRGLFHGVKALELGFNELGKIKKTKEPVESPFNEAL